MTEAVTLGGVTLTFYPGLNLRGCANVVNDKQVAIGVVTDADITSLSWISKGHCLLGAPIISPID